MAENFEKLTDEELYSLLGKKDKSSERVFAVLYARLSPRVYAYCKRFLGNREDAQDVFQEVFSNFYKSANQNLIMTNVQAYILRIARNKSLNIIRNQRPRVKLEDYIDIQTENRDDKDELLNLIKMAIELLPTDMRDIFILREYDCLSYAEIADVTELPITTVKVRLFRAKEKMREILAPYLADLSKY